jgi:hypothetical protein
MPSTDFVWWELALCIVVRGRWTWHLLGKAACSLQTGHGNGSLSSACCFEMPYPQARVWSLREVSPRTLCHNVHTLPSCVESAGAPPSFPGSDCRWGLHRFRRFQVVCAHFQQRHGGPRARLASFFRVSKISMKAVWFVVQPANNDDSSSFFVHSSNEKFMYGLHIVDGEKRWRVKDGRLRDRRERVRGG